MNFYPHHIGDYLTATAHLTWLEDCAYRRLLDVYYSREQAIPTDIAQACRLVRALSKDERKAVETVLREFFTLVDGWTHGRCEEEIGKAKLAAERARVNGKKGGRPAKEKPTANPGITQSVSVANPEKSKSQAPNPNPITNTLSNDKDRGEPRKRVPAKPDDVSDQVWTDWMQLRRTKRAPVTDTVLSGARSEAAKAGMPLEQFLTVWCRRGSQGLEAAWIRSDDRGVGNPLPNKQEALEAANRAVAERWLRNQENLHAA